MSTEFPINSLRHFMLPDQLVYLKSFEANSLEHLDVLVKQWVDQTASIIAVVGSPVKSNEKYLLSLTYVSAVEGNKRV